MSQRKLRMKIVLIAIALSLITSVAFCEIREKRWWNHALIYEVYPRSFMDSNGDGIGDLKGITSKLMHFVDSGVQVIWLTTINRSPMADFGLDVADFTDVDELFGGIDDFRYLIQQAKNSSLKLILDVVPNYTSDQHFWFEQSQNGVGKYADYYIWARGTNNNAKPPNNWISEYGGPAWSYNKKRNMWYLHQFGPRQPDLNYNNPDVRREMQEVFRYWLDEGVDGFCIKSIPSIYDSDCLQNMQQSDNFALSDYTFPNHESIRNQPKTFELLQNWRTLLNDYADYHNTTEKILMTSVHANLKDTADFYNTGSDIPLNFNFAMDAKSHSSAGDFKFVIDSWMKALPENAIPNWVIGNEDYSRTASRYSHRADQIMALAMILPGVAVIYYGEEIGMVDNTNIYYSETQDPIARNAGIQRYKLVSRDPYRTPYQWDNRSNAGFSTSNKTWLPVNMNYPFLNLENEKRMRQSHYHVYEKLAALRISSEALKEGKLDTSVINNNVLVVERSTPNEAITFLMNFSNKTEHNIDFSTKTGVHTILFTSVCSPVILRNETVIVLPARTSAVVHTNLTASTNENVGSKSSPLKSLNKHLKYIITLIIIWHRRY